jgi:hypothetical protein
MQTYETATIKMAAERFGVKLPSAIVKAEKRVEETLAFEAKVGTETEPSSADIEELATWRARQPERIRIAHDLRREAEFAVVPAYSAAVDYFYAQFAAIFERTAEEFSALMAELDPEREAGKGLRATVTPFGPDADLFGKFDVDKVLTAGKAVEFEKARQLASDLGMLASVRIVLLDRREVDGLGQFLGVSYHVAEGTRRHAFVPGPAPYHMADRDSAIDYWYSLLLAPTLREGGIRLAFRTVEEMRAEAELAKRERRQFATNEHYQLALAGRRDDPRWRQYGDQDSGVPRGYRRVGSGYSRS